ncbi:T9SS type A sorting domain-containing protein [Spirosoma rhododendri]|uniref:T9SS type A sorting domain-containing protein n=2 Tax=Spirosoma rhododendri TaxID=2728024 RepID=A0A7L5DX19_9BACT|nr:T9SS type A sorting domain-containing protein [Spirosoma rhododendri]
MLLLLLALLHSVTVRAQAPGSTAGLTISPASVSVCLGSPASLTAGGCPAGGIVRWSTGQTTAVVSVTASQPTTYTATCTVSGTATTTTATVTPVQAVTFTAGPGSITVCSGNTAVLSVALADGTSGTLAWYGDGNPVQQNPTASTPRLTFTDIQPYNVGNYYLTATNACGTTTSRAARVTVPPALTINAVSTPTSCASQFTGQISVTATGGSGDKQYQLNGQEFQTQNTFISLQSGSYVVGVRDALGCSTQTTVEVKPPTPMTLSIRTVDTRCFGGIDGGLVVGVTGGTSPYRYQINGGTAQPSGTFTDLKAGSYTLVVTDNAGCVTAQSALIGSPAAFDIRATAQPTRCAGSVDGSVTIVASNGNGPFQYQLGTGAYQTGTVFTGLGVGPYDFTVRDQIGCTIKRTVTVQQPVVLALTAAVLPVNCQGNASGAITVRSTGGTEPIRYQLTSSRTVQRNPVFSRLALGDYTVVATDTNGCTALLSVTVGKAEPIRLQATTQAARCCVCPTGTVSLTSTGGSGTTRSYQRLGLTDQASNQFGGFVPGSYRFRIADEAGCADTVQASVGDASALSLTVGTVKDANCAGGADGEAAVQIVGGTRPFLFYWQTPRRDTLQSRAMAQTGLTEGTYTVSVRDSNRCTASTAFVTIRSRFPTPEAPVVSQSGSTLRVTGSSGIQWYVQPTGSTSATAITNATSTTLTPFQSGRYYVVTTQNGCASPASNAVVFVLTAIAEPGTELSIRVLPNPIGTHLRLEIEQAIRQTVSLTLHDAGGRSVRQFTVPAFVGKQQLEYPLPDLPAGTYLLRADATDRQATMRVVKE